MSQLLVNTLQSCVNWIVLLFEFMVSKSSYFVILLKETLCFRNWKHASLSFYSILLRQYIFFFFAQANINIIHQFLIKKNCIHILRKWQLTIYYFVCRCLSVNNENWMPDAVNLSFFRAVCWYFVVPSKTICASFFFIQIWFISIVLFCDRTTVNVQNVNVFKDVKKRLEFFKFIERKYLSCSTTIRKK